MFECMQQTLFIWGFMRACVGFSFLFVSCKFTDSIYFSLHILVEIYLDTEAYQFRLLNILKISRCVSLLFSKTMILKVVFSNIMILCLVLLQTFTFFLLSFSTVICCFMIFKIIFNSWKLLEVCCGVKQKQKNKAETKAEQGSKWLTKWPVLLVLGRPSVLAAHTVFPQPSS